MRTKEHEIDTEARKKVLNSFPRNWEHREITGRDYGIDILIEIFESGMPKGNIISIQLKGTESDFTKKLYIDFPVSTLRYSEIFQSPVILMVCQINDPKNRVYFLWLQEYINVVLNFDNPNWRKNKSTVRLFVPPKNIVLNSIPRIEFIAEQPQRLRDFCQLARICSDLEYELEDFLILDNFQEDDDLMDISSYKKNREEVDKILRSIEDKLREVLDLNSILKLFPEVRETTICSAIKSIHKLKNTTNIDHRNKLKVFVNRSSIISPLMATLSMYNDAKYSRFLWNTEKDHLF